MTVNNIQTSRNVTLVGAGPVKKRVLEEALDLAPLLIAADAGAEMARKYGKMPEFIVGDMDSVSESVLDGVSPGNRLRIDEQETTDFDKALSVISAPLILGIGFLGGRADHQMAVITSLARASVRPVALVSEHDVVFAVNGSFGVDLEPGTRVSIHPLSTARVDCRGLRWPLKDIAMATDGLISQSNELVSDRLEMTTIGSVVVYLPAQVLGSVVEALIRSRQTT